MRFDRIAIAAALSAVLAACGGDAPSTNADAPAENTAPPAADTNSQRRVADLSEGERNAVFIRAILDSDYPCQHVESATALPGTGAAESWVARCRGGQAYTITIGPAGNAVVQPGAPAGN